MKVNLGWNMSISTCAGISCMALLIGADPSVAAVVCMPPDPPRVPSRHEDARRYASLIRDDFETYFAMVSRYLSCLDDERARAFDEANETSTAYAAFLENLR